MPVNPKGGTTFDYETVTSIASIGHAFEAAMAYAASAYDMIMMIHVVPLWSMQRR